MLGRFFFHIPASFRCRHNWLLDHMGGVLLGLSLCPVPSNRRPIACCPTIRPSRRADARSLTLVLGNKTMSIGWRISGWLGLVVVCFLGAAATLRIEPVLICAVLAIGLLFQGFRKRPAVVGAVIGLAALSAFSPVGITFRNFPGSPHLTHCCPGIPSHLREALEAQRAGQCVVCSDIVSGFEPQSYLVW